MALHVGVAEPLILGDIYRHTPARRCQAAEPRTEAVASMKRIYTDVVSALDGIVVAFT
jgi:hypothetical protein